MIGSVEACEMPLQHDKICQVLGCDNACLRVVLSAWETQKRTSLKCVEMNE